MPPTTAEPSLSTPPAAPLAIDHVPAATGPLHDFLSQFMSVQNRVTEQQAQLDRELLHMLIEEEKKQTKLLEQILNVAMGLTYTAPRGLSLDATPIHGPALSLSPIPPVPDKEDVPPTANNTSSTCNKVLQDSARINTGI